MLLECIAGFLGSFPDGFSSGTAVVMASIQTAKPSRGQPTAMGGLSVRGARKGEGGWLMGPACVHTPGSSDAATSPCLTDDKSVMEAAAEDGMAS